MIDLSDMFWIALKLSISKMGLYGWLSKKIKKIISDTFNLEAISKSDNTGLSGKGLKLFTEYVNLKHLNMTSTLI